MTSMRSRLEQLEARTYPRGLCLQAWEPGPLGQVVTHAGGQRLEQETGEDAKAFFRRAAKVMGRPVVWVSPLDAAL